MLIKSAVVFFLVSFYETAFAIPEKYWEGNWFPVDPGSMDTNDEIDETLIKQLTYENGQIVDMSDDRHGVKMGISDPECDDAKTNLTTDWSGSSMDYTCFQKRFTPNYYVEPHQKCDHIPYKFWAQHICMNKSIHYHNTLPTFGNHRPLWAHYGEYKYVPKQRWLHNLEHGAIVMLYHPCADIKQVNKLKKILRNCMWKHIISAFNDLTQERPIALLSWGCLFLMNVVDKAMVVNFIKVHGMRGPEEMYGEGFYKKGLIKAARLISDQNDTILCPKK